MNTLAEMQSPRWLRLAEILVIVCLAAVPLFATFPFRVNIFLSWEGAYRLSQGQLPYRDFGMPLGYMYWVVPAVFFKIFGAQLITLVKAQVFLNIVSGLAFVSILSSLRVQPGIRLLSVLLFCLSYSFFNFWPWYNHTVIVYQLVALAFVLGYTNKPARYGWLRLLAGAFFVCCAFLTKQDGGGLALLLCITILCWHSVIQRRWQPIMFFILFTFCCGLLLIVPFLRFSFGYWFNHGQPPHTARIEPLELIDEFFYASQWIKFYLVLTVLTTAAAYRKWSTLFADSRQTLFLLLTLGMLAEAAILQVTSYTPPDNNIYFHSFAVAYNLSLLSRITQLDFLQHKRLAVAAACVLLWWSGTYWKYIQRVLDRFNPHTEEIAQIGGENVVNRHTYMISKDSIETPMSKWVYCGLKSFDRIYMPPSTVEGIQRLLQRPEIKAGKPLRVLNMSELTPLAAEIPMALEQGSHYPLWYHLGVSMFNKEAAWFENQIAAHRYDIVLFEYIPTLNNFYPFRVRDTLINHYRRADVFAAPRRGDTKGIIEVYVPR